MSNMLLGSCLLVCLKEISCDKFLDLINKMYFGKVLIENSTKEHLVNLLSFCIELLRIYEIN